MKSMKDKIITLILLILYCVPYVYLGMVYDYKKRSLLPYYIMVIVFIVGFNYFSTKKNYKMIFIGNILSFVVSYYLAIKKIPNEWDYYFKPFTYGKMVIVVSGVVLLFQIGLLYINSNKAKKP